jgi:hypothetical protein
MTDSQTSDAHEGLADPQGTQSGVPTDGPVQPDGDEGRRSGGHDDEASASSTNDKHASESGGHTIPLEDEQSHPEPVQEEDAVQEENAETSQEQPSEG